MNIEYDENKNISNQQKHGVDFESVHLFDFTTAQWYIDNRQNYGELRVCAFGFIYNRLHSLVFVQRGDALRIISLRKANKREVARYEKHSR